MSGESASTDEEQKPFRTVVWCRPVTWEQCFDGEGMLNKDAMVEKKAENEKLQELIEAQGFVKHESPIAELLGIPLTVWATPSPPTEAHEAAGAGGGEGGGTQAAAKEGGQGGGTAAAAKEGGGGSSSKPKPNAPATVLLASTTTGEPEAQISEMAVVVHSSPEKSLTPQILRNVLLFIHEMRESGIWQGGEGGEPGEPAALSAAIKSWSGFVRQLTYHLRSGLLMEGAEAGPAMPKLQPDGTLKKQE